MTEFRRSSEPPRNPREERKRRFDKMLEKYGLLYDRLERITRARPDLKREALINISAD